MASSAHRTGIVRRRGAMDRQWRLESPHHGIDIEGSAPFGFLPLAAGPFMVRLPPAPSPCSTEYPRQIHWATIQFKKRALSIWHSIGKQVLGKRQTLVCGSIDFLSKRTAYQGPFL